MQAERFRVDCSSGLDVPGGVVQSTETEADRKDVLVTSHRASNSSWHDLDPGAKGIPRKKGCGSSSLSTGVYYELGKDGVKRETSRFLGRIGVEAARRRNLLVRPAVDVYAGEELCSKRGGPVAVVPVLCPICPRPVESAANALRPATFFL